MNVGEDLPSIVDLSGAPGEIGFKHGSLLRETIQRVLDDYFKFIEVSCKSRSHTALTREDCVNLALRYLPYAKEYAPELVEEIHGVGEGAGVKFEELFYLNCFLDMYDLTFPHLSSRLLFGCTTFAASGTATDGEQTYVAQTYDLPALFRRAGVFLRVKPHRGRTVLVFTLAGIVGCAGINDVGMSLVINKLVPDDTRPGVPYPFVVRRALDQVRMGDALEVIFRANRASGINYLLGEPDGEILAVETSASDFEVLYAPDDYLAHTNHYVHPSMRRLETSKKAYSTDSVVRFSRIQKLMRRRLGRITREDMEVFTRDHVNYPFAICRHADEEGSEYGSSETIAAMVLDCQLKEAWATFGNPCKTAFRRIDL